MTYEQAVAYLYQQLPVFQNQGARAYKPGLHTTYQFCERLGNPQTKYRSVHIAGTNGKGSTSHMLAAILQESGYRTGLYTSPHLKSFTERIRVDGSPVSEDFIVDFVQEHRAFIEQVRPSFFEVTVVMAFAYFAFMEVDVAVVEVGMGGRLDSTNVLLPDLCLITNISFDHMQYLGTTLPQIAGEKAGIIKSGVPVVISERQQEDVVAVFEQKSLDLNAPLVIADDRLEVQKQDAAPGTLTVDVKERASGRVLYDQLVLDLSGQYQLRNIKGVLAAVELLNTRGFTLPKNSVRSGLARTTELTGLKGRWQKLGESPLIICDTAHNIAGLTEVLEQFVAMPGRCRRFVLGFVAEKDVAAILKLFPTERAVYYFCAPANLRALEASELGALGNGLGLTGNVYQNVNEALAEAVKDAAPDDLIYVGGSTFVVADINQL
jgi:dihydrofolate synthase / folylpolyglutamate synthase